MPYFPFFVKDAEGELIACALQSKDPLDAEARRQALSAINHIFRQIAAQDAATKEPVHETSAAPQAASKA